MARLVPKGRDGPRLVRSVRRDGCRDDGAVLVGLALEVRQQVPLLRSSLKRAGDLEDAALVVEVADDLEADGKVFAEAAGDADGGKAGD